MGFIETIALPNAGRAADVAFGAMGDAFDQSWKGMLAYDFPRATWRPALVL